MNIDWPLAIVLALVFVAMSFARWRWFRARMLRNVKTPPVPSATPVPGIDDPDTDANGH